MPLTPLAEFISTYYEPQVVVEVGIGKKWDIAIQLSSAGFKVIATDIMDLEPEDFDFVKDDITNPDISLYKKSGLIYSIRPPPELFSSIIHVARSAGADCLIRPLGNEFPQGGELINYRGERFYLWRVERFYLWRVEREYRERKMEKREMRENE
ncbi:MAG: UPF0146 family protein [Archaeoglobaceae archaeon]